MEKIVGAGALVVAILAMVGVFSIVTSAQSQPIPVYSKIADEPKSIIVVSAND